MSLLDQHPHLPTDLARGFHLRDRALAGLPEVDLLASDDPWEVLVGILIGCRRGCFAELYRLRALMLKNRDFFFWPAASELAGCAGGKRFLQWYIDEFRQEREQGSTQYFLPISVSNACGLHLVEHLVDLHRFAAEPDCRYQIERNLSYILEKENGALWGGANEVFLSSTEAEPMNTFDHKGFAASALEVKNQVMASLPTPDGPVFQGVVFDVVEHAKALLTRLRSERKNTERIDRARVLFEASTGTDCTRFYDDENTLQVSIAIPIVERFLKRDDLARFAPGQRYFFGHAIAD